MSFNFKFTSTELRNKFIAYFKQKEHKHLPSSSVVPVNDKSILFVNSGMCQFKKNILNPSNYDLRRAVTIQDCIRAGGKHNDLDEVGKDNYHHTFFQMMGQWSFNDYFKEDSIFYAFDFLTEKLKLNKKFFYATYFCACENALCKESSSCDLESREIWKKYLTSEQILPFGKKENFWEMGSSGPCGPCTEIHYDITESSNIAERKKLVNMDDPSLIEIWNIVFMEYYNDGENLTKLKEKSVDTGMGLERVLAILNRTNNYGTDLFYEINKNIIKKIKLEKINGPLNILLKENFNCTAESTGEGILSNNNKIIEQVRIIADHSRTVAIGLYYNIDFSSEGQGHVLRTIMRRLLHNLYLLTGSYDAEQLISIAASSLAIKFDFNEKIKAEVKLYISTIEKGRRVIENILSKNKNILKQSDIDFLHDTHGINKELLNMLISDDIAIVDDSIKSVDKKVKEVKKEHIVKSDIEKLNLTKTCTEEERLELPMDDLLLIKNIPENRIVEFDEINTNDQYALIFSKTNFYGEMGGQIGDTGIIQIEEYDFTVDSTLIYYNHTTHIGQFSRSTHVDSKIVMLPSWSRRDNIRKNHTATHLFNYCIKQFNNKIKQMGSLVADDRLRFDFNRENISVEILQQIENQVNELIEKKLPVTIREMGKEDLNENIIFMENEEYPDKIRVISIADFNECCGGSHVKNTGDIGLFKITSYSSIGSNRKRIVAVTGEQAYQCQENFKNRRIESLLSIFDKLSLENEEKRENEKRRSLLKNKLTELKEEIKNFTDDFTLEVKNIEQMKDLIFLSKGIKFKGTYMLYFKKEDRTYFIIKGQNAEKFKSTIAGGEIYGKNNFFSGNFKE